MDLAEVDIDVVMTEHYAWRPSRRGWWRVFEHPSTRRVLVETGANFLLETELQPAAADDDTPTAPASTVSRLSERPEVCADVPELGNALRDFGEVKRYRTVDLWESLVYNILRQVIRASQAKQLYRQFCASQGEKVSVPGGGTYPAVPEPGAVADMSAKQFSELGLSFFRRPLVAAAEAYELFAPEWYRLPPGQLVTALRTIHRVGEWTAHAVVADHSGDFAFYPYQDLAVRTWAAQAAPAFDWPTDPTEFSRLWRHLAAGDLHSLTLLTLAWGDHHGKTTA